jgi:hypothetical protein
VNDEVYVVPDSRPARRHQHEHAEPTARKVLLVTKVLVRGDEAVETFCLGAGEEVPVLEVAPASFVSSLDGVARQMISQWDGSPLIEEELHH